MWRHRQVWTFTVILTFSAWYLRAALHAFSVLVMGDPSQLLFPPGPVSQYSYTCVPLSLLLYLYFLSYSISSSPSLVLPKDNKNDFLICFIYQTILCFILILKMSVSKLFLSLCLTKRTTKKLNWITFDFCGLRLKFFLLQKISSSCKRGRSSFSPLI